MITRILSLCAALSALAVSAQTTSFTYQGHLGADNQPLTGLYDFRFSVFNVASNGAPVAATLVFGVGVTDGVFTATLDFGSAIFNGSPLWLDISVRSNNAGASFVALAPRQALTAAPYAIRAQNAASAASVTGPIPDALLSSNVARLNSSAVFTGSVTATGGFLGSGSGLTGISALDAASNGPARALIVNSNGMVGIGTNNPQAALQVAGGATVPNVAAPRIVSEMVNGVGGISNLQYVAAMAVSDGILYVGSYQDRALTAFDVSDPSHPAQLSQIVDDSLKPGSPYTNLDYPFGMVVTNRIAYVPAFNENAVNIISYSNPASPQLLSVIRNGVGQFDRLSGPVEIKVAGGTAYIAALLDHVVNVVDVSNPRNPQKIAVITNTPGGVNFSYPRGLAIAGTNLFVTSQVNSSVTILDVSNPANPRFVTNIVNGTNGVMHMVSPFAITVRSNLAYVACGGFSANGALEIFDISNPRSPQLLAEAYNGDGQFSHLGGGFGLALQGSTAFYVAFVDSTVNVIDVRDPHAPRLVSELRDDSVMPGSPYTKLVNPEVIAVDGDRLYVASDGESAVSILTLSALAGLVVQERVGIGTSTPQAALDVAGDVHATSVNVANVLQTSNVTSTGNIVVDARNVNNGTYTPALLFGSPTGEAIASKRTSGGNQYGLDLYTAFTPRLSIDNFGRVGIGTTTPSSRLQVNGASGTSTRVVGPGGTGAVVSYDLATYDPALFGSATPSAQFRATDNNFSSDVDVLTKQPGNATNTLVSRLHIASDSGNVGVGTTGPAAGLHVASDTFFNTVRLDSGNLYGTWLNLNNTNAGRDWGLISTGAGNGEGPGQLLFRDNSMGTVRMLINTNGYVGVGTLTPTASLEVNGSVRARGGAPGAFGLSNNGFTFNGAGDNDSGMSSSANGQIEFYTDANERMRITPAGNVAIGTNVATDRLVVFGNIRATGTITQGSDRNSKTDFTAVDGTEILRKVLELPISEWRFKAEDAGVRHVGPMAQDFYCAFRLGAASNAIATVDADGIALSAIQALNRKLEAELKEKSARISELERRLENIERAIGNGGR